MMRRGLKGATRLRMLQDDPATLKSLLKKVYSVYSVFHVLDLMKITHTLITTCFTIMYVQQLVQVTM